MARARLAKIFERGLGEIVGHVLPIARTAAGDRWHTGSWFLRSERCYLIPGDSPIGYRLPLDSQPWVAAGDYPFIHPPDSSRSFPALPWHADMYMQLHNKRYHHRHTLTNYALFSVDTDHQISAPKNLPKDGPPKDTPDDPPPSN